MKRFGLMAMTAALAMGVGATVNSSNTFAQMSVTSGAKWTLLALPWVTPGTTGEGNSIILTNLVLTTGLSTGDKLMHYNGGQYEMWTVADGKWVPAQNASETGITQAADPESAAFPRGDGVWLKRASTSAPILLYGQVQSAYGSSTVPAGGVAIVASPKATDLDLSAFNVGASGDEIRTSYTAGSSVVTKTYIRHKPTDGSELKWCTTSSVTSEVKILGVAQQVVKTTYTAATDSIPAGFGFIYKNKSNAQLTIKW